MEEYKYSNMQDLADIADSLDLCRREESHFRNPLTGAYEVDRKRMDIINLNPEHSGRSAVVSNVYHEYQHRDVIAQVAASFGDAKIEGHGTVYDMGDRIMCATFFDNVTALKDPRSEKGIKLGAMFRNSYNKQNSVTGAGYFMRMECLNQMYLGNLIGELKFSERHTGSIVQELPESIAKFTDNLLMRSQLVADSITIANGIVVPFNTREQRLQTMIAMVDHTKVGEMIEAKLTTLEPTKWDIYNAITAVTTHERMGDGVREKMQKISERVLSPSYRVMPAILVRA